MEKKYGTITTSTGETTSNDEILKLKKDEIFHSDRGSQYTSNDFEYLLEKLENKHSYSKKVILMIMQVWKASMPY